MQLSGTTKCCAAYEIQGLSKEKFVDFEDFATRMMALGGTVLYASTSKDDEVLNGYLEKYGGVSQEFCGELFWTIDRNTIITEYQKRAAEKQWDLLIEEEPDRKKYEIRPNDILFMNSYVGRIADKSINTYIRLDGQYTQKDADRDRLGSLTQWGNLNFYYNAEYHNNPAFRRWGYLLQIRKDNLQYVPLSLSQIEKYGYPKRMVLE